MKRRIAMAVLSASVLSAGLMNPAGAQAPAANKVFRFVPHANLAVLDPIWTTAYEIGRAHV